MEADVAEYFWYAMGLFLTGYIPSLWKVKLAQGLEKVS